MKYFFYLIIVFSANLVAHEEPPELWSSFKDLNKSKEACEVQSSFILSGLELDVQAWNEYGLYANIKSSRIVIKCVPLTKKTSKLLVAVAGHDRESVEMIRNHIIRSIE